MNAEPMRPVKVSSDLVRSSSRAAVSIDVHHHFNPTLKDNEGNPWSVQMALDELDQNGVSAAIASLGPVNDSSSSERPRRVRDWNEWGTRTCLDHPGRFGLFASIPVPKLTRARAQLAYAYESLHADEMRLW